MAPPISRQWQKYFRPSQIGDLIGKTGYLFPSPFTDGKGILDADHPLPGDDVTPCLPTNALRGSGICSSDPGILPDSGW